MLGAPAKRGSAVGLLHNPVGDPYTRTDRGRYGKPLPRTLPKRRGCLRRGVSGWKGAGVPAKRGSAVGLFHSPVGDPYTRIDRGRHGKPLARRLPEAGRVPATWGRRWSTPARTSRRGTPGDTVSDMNCTTCGISLTGGIDTFGPHHAPLCSACWFPKPDIKKPPSKKVLRMVQEFYRIKAEQLEARKRGLFPDEDV
jgi:hypothetical protein